MSLVTTIHSRGRGGILKYFKVSSSLQLADGEITWLHAYKPNHYLKIDRHKRHRIAQYSTK